MIRDKAKSLYDNLKQKEGGGSTAGEFKASKRWFDNFRKRLGLKNVNMTGGDSADREVADKFPDTVKKITEEKDI